jgi:hypothetical protein
VLNSNLLKYSHLIPLLFVSIFAAWGMHYELYYPEIHYSDGTFHLSVLKYLDTAFDNGRNPFDFWYSGTPFGFALFRSYQYFPYIFMYVAYLLTFKLVSLAQIMAASNLILVVALPWTFYFGLRAAGLCKTSSIFTSILSVLIADGGEFGLGLQNYTFGTNGLYTQLWALVFLPLAIGYAYKYLSSGTNLIIAVFFGFLTFGSHVIAAFIVNFSVLLFCAIFIFNKDYSGIKRTFIYFLILGLLTAHQWLFVFIDAPFINQSALEPAWKYNGRGIEYILNLLWSGKALDVGRFPSLTVLLLASICFGIFAPNKDSKNKFVNICFYALILFFTLYVGRQIWGWLFADMPALKSLHIHRFAIGFHFYTLVLIGAMLAYIYKNLKGRNFNRVIFILCLAALLAPAYIERAQMYIKSRNLRISSGEYLASNKQTVDLISNTDIFKTGPIYGGANYNWGLQTQIFGIPSYFFPTAAGYTTVGGSLFHAFSLAGETLFDFNVARKSHYELYGIRSVVSQNTWKGLDGFSQLGTSNNISVWSTNLEAFSFGVKNFDVCGEQKQASAFMRRWLQSSLPDTGSFGQILPGKCPTNRDGLVNYIDLPPNTSVDNKNIGKIIESYHNEYKPWFSKAKVQMNSEGLVILPTGYHPNWTVSIDGSQAKTMWVTPGFVAATVPAGIHMVEFEYKGSSLKTVAVALSCLFFMICLALKVRMPNKYRTNC